MKILFVRPTPVGAPGEMAAQAIPVMLCSLGHSVTMIAKTGGDATALRQAGVNVVEVEGWGNWFRTQYYTINEVTPDIVHVFIHAGCGLYPFLFKFICHSKFVLDIRSPLLSTGFRRLVTQFKNRFEPLGYDLITAHSIGSAWTVLGQRSDIHYIPPGVYLDKVPVRAICERHSELIKAIYIGSLHKLRQIPKLISAFILANGNGKKQMCLDVYGQGEDQDIIQKIIDQNNMSSSIKLMGVIPQEDLLSILGNYDIGLAYVPQHTVYDPAPPLKTVEFLAAGLATVATNTPGNALIINHGENGILAEDDPESFAEGILCIAQNYELRYRLAAQSRSSVEMYDWRQIVQQKLLPLYQNLLQ